MPGVAVETLVVVVKFSTENVETSFGFLCSVGTGGLKESSPLLYKVQGTNDLPRTLKRGSHPISCNMSSQQMVFLDTSSAGKESACATLHLSTFL